MKKIVLINVVIAVLLLPMACNPISEEVAINRAYDLVQSICDKNKELASFPKSAYYADKEINYWSVKIEGFWAEHSTKWGKDNQILFNDVIDVDAMEKKKGSPNPRLGKAIFHSNFVSQDRYYYCGTRWYEHEINLFNEWNSTPTAQ